VRDLAHAAERLRSRNPRMDPALAALLAWHGTVPCEDGGETRTWSFDRRHLLRSPTPFVEQGFRQALAAITAPTLVVWAEESWYAPEVRARRVAALAQAQVITLPGGHMLPYESPVALGDALREHLAF